MKNTIDIKSANIEDLICIAGMDFTRSAAIDILGTLVDNVGEGDTFIGSYVHIAECPSLRQFLGGNDEYMVSIDDVVEYLEDEIQIVDNNRREIRMLDEIIYLRDKKCVSEIILSEG